MKILENKSNYIVIEGETEIQCYSYNTMMAVYNKVMNNYHLINEYNSGGITKPLSKTSKKHQNIFIREYIPSNAILINE